MNISDLFKDLYKEFPELREESQLDMGKNVEKEHKPTVEWIENEVEDTGKIPPNKEIYASIAKDHLNEFPTYYTALDKMEKELKESSYIPAPKKDSPEYKRVMQKWNSRLGMRKDDPDFEILKRILSDSAWEEEIVDEKEDYDVTHDLQEGIGDFIKGAAKQAVKSVGQTALNAAKKVPIVSSVVGGLEKATQAGMQAHQQASETEANLQSTDMESVINNIFDALKTYTTSTEPSEESSIPVTSQQQTSATKNPAPNPLQPTAESFDVFQALQKFEKEHLIEAGMSKETFKGLVGKYVKSHEANPMEILKDSAALDQLRGIIDSAKKFGLTLPYSPNQFKDTLAAYQKNVSQQPQKASTSPSSSQSPQTAASAPQNQNTASRYSQMTLKLISILQDPNQSSLAMNAILKGLRAAAVDKTGKRSQDVDSLLKQLGSKK